MRGLKKILVAEDDQGTRRGWVELITAWGYSVDAAEDGIRALEQIERFEPHILMLDLKLPRMHGLEVLASLRERNFALTTIVISGEGEIPDAVKAMKLGAYDYLQKPVDLSRLKVLLHNLSEHIDVSVENRHLRHRLMQAGELGPLIGNSQAMRGVLETIEQIAPSNAPAILTGESGCGKEIAARTIHELSSRRSGAYIAVNCAALPETLMESELFGHERGAFTGADTRREGCFEMARGGTLLLDEISEMKVELQAKLLRVLEEHKMRRLGGTVEVPLDVRVLAASNRDLGAAIRDGKFRQDLFFRLSVFSIEIPPLRRRLDDLAGLISHFIRLFARTDRCPITGVDSDCMAALKAHSWPGNVRELRNVVQRAAVVARGPLITIDDLPPEVLGRKRSEGDVAIRLGVSLDEAERELILRTLDSVNGNKVRAAEILGVSLKTLYNRLGKYRANEHSDNGKRLRI
jgi:DNA-binding NtrC family response regulator